MTQPSTISVERLTAKIYKVKFANLAVVLLRTKRRGA